LIVVKLRAFPSLVQVRGEDALFVSAKLVGRECSPVVESKCPNSEAIDSSSILQPVETTELTSALSVKIVSDLIRVFRLDSSYSDRFAGCVSPLFSSGPSELNASVDDNCTDPKHRNRNRVVV